MRWRVLGLAVRRDQLKRRWREPLTGEAYGVSSRIHGGGHVDERLLRGRECPIRSPGEHDDARGDDAGKGCQLHTLVAAEVRPKPGQNRNAETCAHHFLDRRVVV